jgi:hypothetical protein
MTPEELTEIRQRLTTGRVAHICPECKEEPVDYSNHPRPDGTWQARCLDCLSPLLDVQMLPVIGEWRTAWCPEEELLEEVERLHTLLARPKVCLTCGGQGTIGDGGYVLCPVCHVP